MALPPRAHVDSFLPIRQCVTRVYYMLLTLMSRRYFRLVFISFSLLFITFFLYQASGHGPSLSDVAQTATGYKTHESIIPTQAGNNERLPVFPETPMAFVAEEQNDARLRAPWLAVVISPAYDVDRRMLIRSTYMRLYADLPWDPRFVVSNPGPKWIEAVRFENRTYGDIVVLDHLPEESVTAKSIKALEFYKHLVKQGRRYEFVSMIDTDLFFNARGLWDRYLKPRLKNVTTSSSSMPSMKATVERTAIGQLYYSRPNNQAFPHGSLYTHTWDLVELLAKLQEENPVFMGDDQAVTRLLRNAGEQAYLINVNGTEHFDYDDADARTADSPYARIATHPQATLHALYGGDVLGVHQVKDRSIFMKVAGGFDSKGIIPAPPSTEPEKAPPFYTRMHDLLDSFGLSTRFESHEDRLPNALYHRQGDDWIVDKVWNMGQDKTGYQK